MDNNTSAQTQHAVRFHGKNGEYFTIWLVNVILTVITLGIYSAWATVRRRRYFYGNTEINGDRFEYHAKPINILLGRIIVVGGLLIFFVLSSVFPAISLLFVLAFCALIPWIVIRSWRYSALMSSFRGVRFNYLCRTGRAYWVLFFCPLLMIVALYLLVALAGVAAIGGGTMETSLIVGVICFVVFLLGISVVQGITAAMTWDLYVNNLSYGSRPFNALLSKKAFISIVLKSLLFILPGLVIAGYLASKAVSEIIFASAMGIEDPQALSGTMMSNMSGLFVAWLVMLISGIIAVAYLQVAQRNYVYNRTAIGDGLRLKSMMQTGSFMALLFTNVLLVVFTLGLCTPIAELRLARYIARCTQLVGDMSLTDLQTHHDPTGAAVAEAAVATFDLNPGI